MNLDVQIDGAATQLEVDRTGDEYRFRLGSGPEHRAHMLQVEPGLFSVLLNGRSYQAHAEPGAAGVCVSIGGRRFEVVVTDPRRWTPRGARSGAEGRINIVAPMPGKIVRVLAAPGDAVEAGQGILVVEAMKMQNEMKSPRSGRVIAVTVREGETVGAGAVLATIES